MPRCWPPAYGSFSAENDRKTGPSAGHAQPAAGEVRTSERSIPTARAATLLPDLTTMRANSIGRLGCCQIWLQRAAVETIPGGACQAGNDVGGLPPTGPRLDELRERGQGLPLVALGHRSAADDERDLALRRLGEPRRDLRRRPTNDILEALRQFTADGDGPIGPATGQRGEARRQAPGRLE